MTAKHFHRMKMMSMEFGLVNEHNKEYAQQSLQLLIHLYAHPKMFLLKVHSMLGSYSKQNQNTNTTPTTKTHHENNSKKQDFQFKFVIGDEGA